MCIEEVADRKKNVTDKNWKTGIKEKKETEERKKEERQKKEMRDAERN